MATGMANARQGIIFCVEINQATTVSTSCFEGRIETIRMTSDREPMLLKEITNGVVGSMLLVGGFWIGPDLATELVSKISLMTGR